MPDETSAAEELTTALQPLLNRVGAVVVADEPQAETASPAEVATQLNSLPARQRDVLQSIAVESASIKDTAAKLAMSEGAVRVALHRGLSRLTAKLREP